MAIPIKSIKFWINAFIPKNVVGYTKPVPKKPTYTMIPGPFHSADCFYTDQRSFSNQIHAKSRMHSEFKLDFTGTNPSQNPKLTQWHNCDFTTECNCEDGEVECHKKGETIRMKIKWDLANAFIRQRGLYVIQMNGHASNPCSPISRVGGDIDYEGKITIDLSIRRITFDGKVDAFPAFEAYATINDGAGVELFRLSPPLGNTVMNLPGGASRKVKAYLEDSNLSGIFLKKSALSSTNI